MHMVLVPHYGTIHFVSHLPALLVAQLRHELVLELTRELFNVLFGILCKDFHLSSVRVRRNVTLKPVRVATLLIAHLTEKLQLRQSSTLHL